MATLVCLFGCLILSSSTVQAQLAAGGVTASSRVTASNGPLCLYTGVVAGWYPCSTQGTFGNTSFFARGASRGTFGYRTGFARVQGSAQAIFSGVGSPSNGSASAQLDSRVYYSLDMPLVTIPPPGYTGQPLPILVTGTVSGLNSGNSTYGATLRIAGLAGSFAWEANSFGLPNQSIIASVNLDVDEEYVVELHASCTATASALPGGESLSSCQATADPTFEFDQAAWDLLLGEDTFPLADYFSIELSENLVATPLAVDMAKYVNSRLTFGPNEPSVPRIALGETVTWSYEIANLGDNAIPFADLIVTDSDPRLNPTLDPSSDEGGDLILSPFEVWEYTASAPALNLSAPPSGVTVVPGCYDDRNTYQNTGRVEIAGTGIFDEAVSYYCNDQIYPVPTPTSSPQGLIGLVMVLGAIGILFHRVRDRQAG